MSLSEIIGALPANVLAGFIGAFMVWLLRTIPKKYSDAQLNKKYSLTGKYVTKYEDLNQDDEVVWRKASAKLTQKGSFITGETKNLDDGRAWKLNLSLTKQKYLTGTYFSESPHDPGMGTVFLEIVSPGHLEGIWTGYDAVHKSIQKGLYKFSKCLPVLLQDLDKNYLPQTLALFGSSLGEKYITRPQLEEYLSNPANTEKKGFVAVRENNVVGAVICEIVPPERTKETLLIPDDKLKKLLPDAPFHTLGLIKSLAVSKDFRGHGIATFLTKEAVKWLKSKGATRIVAIAWISNGVCNAKNVLESCGFRQVGTIEKFWHVDSLEKGYLCPDCGNPCNCSAIILAV